MWIWTGTNNYKDGRGAAQKGGHRLISFVTSLSCGFSSLLLRISASPLWYYRRRQCQIGTVILTFSVTLSSRASNGQCVYLCTNLPLAVKLVVLACVLIYVCTLGLHKFMTNKMITHSPYYYFLIPNLFVIDLIQCPFPTTHIFIFRTLVIEILRQWWRGTTGPAWRSSKHYAHACATLWSSPLPLWSYLANP